MPLEIVDSISLFSILILPLLQMDWYLTMINMKQKGTVKNRGQIIGEFMG